jgi:hypothetical protein
MGSKSKNKEVQKYNKYKEAAKQQLIEHTRNEFLKENVGNIINHFDRVYKIMPDGSWRRITPKNEIIRNSKDYKK